MKKVKCKAKGCLFNASEECIKNEISLNVNNDNFCCNNLVRVTDEELERLKEYYFGSLLGEVKDELAQEKFKNENLQQQIDEYKEKLSDKAVKGDRTTEILEEAREKAHPVKTNKIEYTTEELEEMYISENMTLMQISKITGIPKSTIYNRLKAVGATWKKDTKE